MIHNLFDISKKYIRYHKASFISSILGIMVSIALIINMFGLAINSERMLMDELKKEYGTIDMFISLGDYREKHVDIAATINALDGVNEMSRVHISYTTVEGSSVYTAALDDSNLAKSRYKYKEDLKEGYVILNKGLADYLNLSKGDDIHINGQTFIINELISDVVGNQKLPDMVLMTNESIALIKGSVSPTHIMIDIKDDKSIVEYLSSIRQVYPGLMIDQMVDDASIKENISSLNSFMILLCLISLMMCILFLLSNFQLFLYNYKKQVALLRAIGAKRLQAFKTVFLYASLINVVGLMAALVFSVFSNKLIMPLLGKSLFDLEGPMDFNLSLSLKIITIAFVILETMMIYPSVKSTNILPVEITSANEKLEASKWYSITGAIFVVIGLTLYGQVIYEVIKNGANGSEAVVPAIISICLLLIGFYLLFVQISKKILTALVKPFSYVFGRVSGVALKIIIPQVKKNVLVILSITTLVIITVIGSSLLDTINHNNTAYLEKEFVLDVVLTNRDDLAYDQTVESLVADLPSVDHFIRFNTYFSALYIKGDSGYVTCVKADTKTLVESGIIKNDIRVKEDEIIISTNFANSHNLSVGDGLIFSTDYKSSYDEVEDKTTISQKKYRVVAIDSLSFSHAQIIFDLDDGYFQEYGQDFDLAHIKSNDIKSTFDALDTINMTYGGLKWTTMDIETEKFEEQLYKRWKLFIIIVITIIVMLIIGSMNMLINNILSRRSEYGTLRLFKISRKDFIQIILTQVLTYNMVGLVYGGVLGVVFSNMLSLSESGHLSQVNLKLAGVTLMIILLISLLVFIPLGYCLSKKNISEEIYESR